MALTKTSLNYDFPSTFNFKSIVDTAYQRAGIGLNDITDMHLDLARDWANLEMHQWSAKHTSLCWIERNLFTFVTGQTFYKLPSRIYKVLEGVKTFCLPVTITNMILQGAPFASEGNAIPVFTPTSSSGLTQTTPGGCIGFSFNSGLTPSLWYVGISTLVKRNYTLAVQYSFDNVNWETAKQSPTMTYLPGQITWIVCEWPPAARYWRIIEMKNAVLAIQQLYFCQPNQKYSDIPMGVIARTDFVNYAQKINPGSTPTSYYFNEKEDKTLYIYGNNYLPNMAFMYTAKIYPQDVDHIFQQVDVDVKFYYALVAAISYHAAINFNTQRVQFLQPFYDQIYSDITADDGESAPLRISVNLSQNWSDL